MKHGLKSMSHMGRKEDDALLNETTEAATILDDATKAAKNIEATPNKLKNNTDKKDDNKKGRKKSADSDSVSYFTSTMPTPKTELHRTMSR